MLINKVVELKNIELFKDLTAIDELLIVADLHNDYDCTSIDYSDDSKMLTINFTSNNRKVNRSTVYLRFEDATLMKFDLAFKAMIDKSTLNILYRGRFESNNGLLEYSEQKGFYFYMEFEEGDKFEFFAQKMLVQEHE